MKSFYCRLIKDGREVPNLLGVAVSDHMLTVMDPENQQGFKVVPQIGVIWFKEELDEEGDAVAIVPSNSPAPSYHGPEQLRALGLESENETDDFIGDDGEEDDDVDPDEVDAAHEANKRGVIPPEVSV